MHTKRTRRNGRLLVGLSLLFLVGSALATPAAAAPSPANEVVAVPARTDLSPPPAPVTRDGKRLPGVWVGPYTYRNAHSGKCLDVSSAGQGAIVIQDQCWAGDTTQAWWKWEYMGDGFVSYSLLANSAANGCATGISERQALWITGCAETEPQTWYRTSDRLNEYINQMTHLCMEVGGWSTANGATVMSWDCLGNPNQIWFTYDWH